MNYTFFQQPLNLTKENASIYALGVNMTQSRQPAPEFPFKGLAHANCLISIAIWCHRCPIFGLAEPLPGQRKLFRFADLWFSRWE